MGIQLRTGVPYYQQVVDPAKPVVAVWALSAPDGRKGVLWLRGVMAWGASVRRSALL